MIHLMKTQTGFWMLMNPFDNGSPKEVIMHGLSELHKNLALLEILEFVHQSYEADDNVLFKSCLLIEENTWDYFSTI